MDMVVLLLDVVVEGYQMLVDWQKCTMINIAVPNADIHMQISHCETGHYRCFKVFKLPCIPPYGLWRKSTPYLYVRGKDIKVFLWLPTICRLDMKHRIKFGIG